MWNLLDYELNEIRNIVIALGEKAFRAEQVFGWLAKGVKSFDEMSNVPASLIAKLKDDYFIGMPEIVNAQKSSDGTVKCLLAFSNSGDDLSGTTDASTTSSTNAASSIIAATNIVSTDVFSTNTASTNAASPNTALTTIAATAISNNTDDKNDNNSSSVGIVPTTEVEAVFMKYVYGNSICISSQAGCRMGCTFCASTMDGLERNLSGGEMLAEVLAVRNYTGEDIGHVVIMGMGEPFDNYEEISKFIKLIHDPKGYNLSMRNITVSTCGLVPYIKRFGEDFPQVNLAISLHAPNQELRERTMPVAKRYGYDELIKACRDYTESTRRRITFEYALIDGVNDSAECAKELAGKLKGMLAHVNLIPLNEVKGREYRQSRGENVKRFKDVLEKNGIAVTVRRTLGSDIDAACGQLKKS